jgi:hypothetical protein
MGLDKISNLINNQINNQIILYENSQVCFINWINFYFLTLLTNNNWKFFDP